MTPTFLGRSRARRALLLSTAALGAAAVAAPAAPAAVTLDWSNVNTFSGAQRTWLGYVTNPSPMGGAKGTASPIAPATGPTITPANPKGLDQLATWSLPAVSGSVDPVALRGSLQFGGGIKFTSPATSAGGHGFTITLENPRVELSGPDTGLIYATGLRTAGPPDSPPAPYDSTQPVFAFDRTSSWTLNADGSSTITIAPRIATDGWAFPGGVERGYPVGSGPDRNPNTFGSFTIRFGPDGGPKGDKGDKGDAGAKGQDGRNGANGRNGTTKVIRVQTSTLRKAPFKGKAARKVRVTARKSSKTLATGTVRGRTLTVTLAADAKKKRLKGVYVLRLVGKKTTATVRIP